MLAIISDLHINDGTTGQLLPPGTIDLVCERLCDLAWRASWRADGCYRPIDRIDLVLLGDVLDIMSSRRWLASPCRPWDDNQSPAVIDCTTGIVEEILRRNVDCIRTLRSLATESTVSLPPATAAGQPVLEAEEMPVAVCTHYMVGNRDWPLHLKGTQYDLIRHKVTHHLGLVTSYNKPFPHEAMECDQLQEALKAHRILARHGDIFDPLCFADDRDCASLGDVITIELIARFLQHVENELADQMSDATWSALCEIDQIRPMLLVPAYMESLLERTAAPAIRNRIKRMWDYMVEQMLQMEIVRRMTSTCSIDMIDGLAAALKFTRRDSQNWIGRTMKFMAELRGASSCSYASQAMAESDFRNRRARHIVYGHTHQHEIMPLDASHADGYVLNQTYFNAGSCRRSYQPTQMLAGNHELCCCDTFSLLCFYQSDERSGRTHETWCGTLAPMMFDMAAAEIAPNSAAMTSAPAAAPIRAPQFAGNMRANMARSY
jgi:UDP-2,3-diacylglucosamine pyrophosphatase LpxH